MDRLQAHGVSRYRRRQMDRLDRIACLSRSFIIPRYGTYRLDEIWVFGKSSWAVDVDTLVEKRDGRGRILLRPFHQSSLFLSSRFGRREDIFKRTAIVFAIIRNHKHDLPFEDVIIHKTATYPGDVFIALHQLELATQEPGGC